MAPRRWVVPRHSIAVAGLAGLFTVAVLLVFAALAWPHTRPGEFPGALPDSLDYAYGALGLLHGQYVVAWDGGAPRIPRYPPGFPLLLTPAVALGGIEATPWVPFASALLLGLLGAYVAARLAGYLAAPLGAAMVLFSLGTLALAEMVMSDLPVATLTILLVALSMADRRAGLVMAGALGGCLVWIRPAAVTLLLAGLVAITGHTHWGRSARWYALGALVPLVALGWWQYQTFGSPFNTTYQVAMASPNGSAELGAFFAPRYVFGQPFSGDGALLGGGAHQWGLPNGLAYPLQLVGFDGFLSLPGVGLFGLVSLARFARQNGSRAVFGRFGLASVALLLVVYMPYFWQSARFLIAAGSLLCVAAAAGATDAVLSGGRRRAVLVGEAQKRR